MGRTIILIVVLVFLVGFGYATLLDASQNGVGLRDLLAILVLALFGFGIVGALLHPPDE